jgi:TonB family protein
MTAVESWILSYLVNSLWQVPLLFAAGLLAARLLRSVSLAAEHRVWVGVLLLESILPACSAAQFAWLRGFLVWSFHPHQAGGGIIAVTTSGVATQGNLQFPALLLTASVLAYGFITAYFAARFLWRFSRLRAMRSSAVESTLDGDAALAWAHCGERFGVRNASVATSSRLFAPVTMGISRKLLLLPAGLESCISPAEMHCIIAHEFAHMRRNDFAKNLLYELLSLPVSYHPAFRFTRERLTESREIVCDQIAADLTSRSLYSRSLLRLASLLVSAAPARAAHAVGIFDTNILERRLMKLAKDQSEIRGLRRLAAIGACLALAAATCASALALHMQVNSADSTSHHGTMHPSHPVNVSPKTMEQNIVTKVQPKYPVEAKKAGIQGKVVLRAIIDKEGNVTNLKVDSGPKELRQSSLDAVRQWKYKPYLLNGQPVAVATTVNIYYCLAKPGQGPSNGCPVPWKNK